MQRSAPRLTRILACAAVPVMLVAAGCSSDSGSDGADGAPKQSPTAAASPSPTPTPTVEPAVYGELPEPCKAVAEVTIKDLVPEVKRKGGTPGQTSDTASRGSCSWNGLDDKGVKGSQYRWLDVSLLRYESDPSLGSGEQRATENFAKEVAKVKATQGAKDVKSAPAKGLGDEAMAIGYGLKKSDEDFTYAAIVTRTENVVVTISYNGAGFAGSDTPDREDLAKQATRAARDAVKAVAAANK
ncbi:DUF3558 family protein [Streptomyces lichenis]|uniref:DUF3558 domain-containing protein n=1 Tax=Streptomyces lichenis TaxID=2306967 RepID=A0ABT0IIJ4_9ACTN|nr:DUF3558 family protein [Streptomyces lichenis]MCK8681155.1 DUF3558 domain-containing protein [Streptomyces lichenis]